MALKLAESLTLSVTAAAAACGLAMASGGGLLLGLALYIVVGSVTLLSACSLSALEERVHAESKAKDRRAYA